ncbi:erythromycin esterase family protein [Paenibacillus sp. SC116]|uniref:erythromycin esterase family protein n=1 Tax=Paenibacillus sp. SC116 TaxID=2968986 RepID=UPI00215A4B6C|nr:erythromycin esterase family protein [Paenibacillus sp. SC116]MCR8842532.1 erythromycin esterase family protein [Paenibacillus sp. SC116]
MYAGNFFNKQIAMQNARSIYVNYSGINDSLLRDYSKGYGYLHFMSGMNSRDAAMKEKVDWVLNQANGPILVAGHNGHINNKNQVSRDIMVQTAKIEEFVSIAIC